MLSDSQWRDLVVARAEAPTRALERLRSRTRRPLLTDGRLFIVAADHTARGMLGVPGDAFALADRRRTMEVPNVRGLVVGRSVLFPHDGDVAAPSPVPHPS